MEKFEKPSHRNATTKQKWQRPRRRLRRREQQTGLKDPRVRQVGGALGPHAVILFPLRNKKKQYTRWVGCQRNNRSSKTTTAWFNTLLYRATSTVTSVTMHSLWQQKYQSGCNYPQPPTAITRGLNIACIFLFTNQS